MFFVDDLILFGRTTTSEAEVFLRCLDTYRKWSSQSINMEKSRVHFSKKICGSPTSELCDILNFSKAPLNSRYLRLPLLLNNSKKQAFGDIVERVHNCICR